MLLPIILLSIAAQTEMNAVTSIDLEESADKTTLTINLASSSGYDKKALDSGKLTLIIPECSVTKQTLVGAKGSTIVNLEARNNAKNAELTLSFTSQASSYRGYATISPPRVILEIVKKPLPQSMTTTNATPDATKSNSKGQTPKDVTTGVVDLTPVLTNPTTKETPLDTPTKKDLNKIKTSDKSTTLAASESRGTIKRIILDPGHGGPYVGCGGLTSGVEEKIVTLKIAYKLKKKLEERLGVKVYLTRKDDSNILMRERIGLANRVKGDLFISIHLNGDNNTKAHGTEVYFLSEARTDDERAIAALENADFEVEMEDIIKGSGLNLILGNLTQNEFLAESSELAELVQTNLIKKLSLSDRGVKQAPFYVLMYTYMPSILVEVGFMSNKDEEKKLLDPSFQDKTADALCDAISEYKKRYEKKTGVSPEPSKTTETTKSTKDSKSKKK